MSITYLGDTTEFEEGKTYTLRWSVPDYAGQKLWVYQPFRSHDDYAEDNGVDFTIKPKGGYGGGWGETDIDANGIASITIEAHQDNSVDPDEWFFLDFKAGDNLYRSESVYETSKYGSRTEFSIKDSSLDIYGWEFQFSESGLRPITDVLEGEQLRGDGYRTQYAHLSIIPKETYPIWMHLYYKIFAETGSSRELAFSGRFYWHKGEYIPESSIRKFSIRDDDQDDTTYVAYVYDDENYTNQIGNSPSLIVRDFDSYSYDGYNVRVGAGDGSNIWPSVDWPKEILVEKKFIGSDSSDVLKGYSGDNFGADLIDGGNGDDEIFGYRGADFLNGGNGSDLLRAGNGRDIITGGTGSDTMYGGFGLNTFEDADDGEIDQLLFKSDQHAYNWIYDKDGNSPNGEKADKIMELDPFDEIFVQGVETEELSFGNVFHYSNLGERLDGIGIYALGTLEAVYVGDNLSLGQIEAMTQGLLL